MLVPRVAGVRRRVGFHVRDITSTAAIRENFLQFFERHEHKRVPSSGLIPNNDPTLLFTNAGMVQFKDVMSGKIIPSFVRATTAQKCLRAGGKHNDLENVGYTNRHHTFFEMLGNFSFGDYSKEQAIVYAWNYVTKELRLPIARLLITVHHNDNEARELWKKVSGLSDDFIVNKGDEDNFWAMGDSGPCGYCSEIFYDQLEEVDGERYLEIWNLVFMGLNRVNGKLFQLEKPCIDTGMGLERIASVLQGVKSNYEIDLLSELMRNARDIIVKSTQVSPQNSFLHSKNCDLSQVNPSIIALRVIVDHVRASAFLISEGVIPGATGKNYVLRRILRRAIRYANVLGISATSLNSSSFLAQLVDPLVTLMGDAYPQLQLSQQTIKNVILNEELLFFVTLEKGTRFLNEAIKNPSSSSSSSSNSVDSKKTLSGEVCFTLLNEYGFPLDLTQLIVKDEGYEVDENKFLSLLEDHKELSRQSSKIGVKGKDHILSSVLAWKQQGVFPEFSGYHSLSQNAKIIALTEADEKEYVWVTLSPCPFYGEGGGQIGDIGELIVGKEKCRVVKSIKPYPKGIALKVHDREGKLEVGMTVQAQVDQKARRQTSCHHSATHLLNAALRAVLPSKNGEITQAGSLVDCDKLRFDFTYRPQISASEIQQIEDWINERCSSNSGSSSSSVLVEEMSKTDALKTNAIFLLGEDYDDVVRVVKMGDQVSTELCGGTHVTDLSQVYPFKIVNVTSVSAGTKRIEAVCGEVAVNMLMSHSSSIFRIANLLRVSHDQAENAVIQLFKRSKAQKAELEKGPTKSLEENKTVGDNVEVVIKQKQVGSVSVGIHRLKLANPDLKTMQSYGEGVFAKEPGCYVLVCEDLVMGMSDPRVKYKEFVGARGLLQKLLQTDDVLARGYKFASAVVKDPEVLLALD